MKPKQGEKRTVLDWAQVRQRLARALAATEESERLTPERKRQVLEERARLLARPTDSPVAAPPAQREPKWSGSPLLEVVVFTLGNEEYALETRHVREVVRLADWTPLPGAPAFLLGVLNLRGDILAVLDLRSFFGIVGRGEPGASATGAARVLVLGTERAEFGMLADAAREVRAVRADEVLEPPGSLAGAGREYVRGVTKEALVVLDGAVLLQDRRLFIDQDEHTGP
jgi:purine-binding chemotaxis protein CheW